MNCNLNHRVALPGLVRLGQLALAIGVAAALPSTASAQLKVEEVCTPILGCTLAANKPPVRRGKTETIHLKGPFVDHTIKSGVTSAMPGVTVSSVAKTTCVNDPCLAVALAVAHDFNLTARVVTIFVKNVFGTTAFNITIVRKGEIKSMTQDPVDPSWGQAVNVRITGDDIGNTRAAVTASGVANLDKATSEPSDDAVTFTVVGNQNTTPRTSTDVTIGDAAVSGSAGNYKFTITKRTVNYRPASGGASCITTPGITAPAPSYPANGAILTYTDNPTLGRETLRWTGGQGQFKSTEKYVLEITPLNPSSYTTGEGVMSKYLEFPRNTDYQWRVKAYNCGVAAPFSGYSRFTVR